jgi:hypothetical protein
MNMPLRKMEEIEARLKDLYVTYQCLIESGDPEKAQDAAVTLARIKELCWVKQVFYVGD